MKFIFFLLILNIAYAQDESEFPEDYEARVDYISDKYFAGAFLIYDCEEKHWVCVMEIDYKSCEKKRKESLDKFAKYLSCAPIGQFPSKKGCFQRVQFLTGHDHGNRFCLLDELKREEKK